MAQVLIVYVISRVLDFLIISRVARFQAPSLWNGPDPGYLGVRLAVGRRLVPADRRVRLSRSTCRSTTPGMWQQNEWAFYPLYPFTVRGVMWLLGTGWPVSASIVSLVCGALAVVVMRSLVEPVAGRALALWTVALFCFFPPRRCCNWPTPRACRCCCWSAALWCLQRRRYLLAVPVVLLIGFARPIGVPVAAVVGLHVLIRLPRRRRAVTAAALATMAALLVAAAGRRGGVDRRSWRRCHRQPDGYAETMAAWRARPPDRPAQALVADVAVLSWASGSGPVVLVACVVASRPG